MTDEHPFERPPTSEEEMRAATVGELVVHGATIHLADYDPSWPRLYEREATRIRSVLGDRVRRLEHVGSTSVPGLAAKPIIDIVMAVPDSADEPAYVPDMEAAGYVAADPRAGLVRAPAVQGAGHEHQPAYVQRGVRRDRSLPRASATGCARHDDDRDLYERTKRELAAREWRYVQHYADAKTGVVEGIIARAQAGGALS